MSRTEKMFLLLQLSFKAHRGETLPDGELYGNTPSIEVLSVLDWIRDKWNDATTWAKVGYSSQPPKEVLLSFLQGEWHKSTQSVDKLRQDISHWGMGLWRWRVGYDNQNWRQGLQAISAHHRGYRKRTLIYCPESRRSLPGYKNLARVHFQLG